MGIGFIKGIIAILKGQKSPAATAAGFATGAMMGLIPKGNLLGAGFFLIFFLTTMDKPAAILSALLWTPIGIFLDPWAHQIGYFLLEDFAPLKPFWTMLFNWPIVPWTSFNNTAVLGHLVIGFVAWVPLFLVMKSLMSYYQKNLKTKVESLKVVQALKALKIYQWYESIGGE